MLDNELIVVCIIDPDTRKPSYEVKGRWTGRWLKMAMAKMPLAYRKHMAEILKKEKSDDDRKPNEPSEPIRSTNVQRSGQTTKRDGNLKTGKRKAEARQ